MRKIKIKSQIPQILPKTISMTIIENILFLAYQELKNAKTIYAYTAALRNTAIIELLFATGQRVSELCSFLYSGYHRKAAQNPHFKASKE